MVRIKRFKGCCHMCAAWTRGDGIAIRRPFRDLRRIGRRRRITHRVQPEPGNP